VIYLYWYSKWCW